MAEHKRSLVGDAGSGAFLCANPVLVFVEDSHEHRLCLFSHWAALLLHHSKGIDEKNLVWKTIFFVLGVTQELLA